MDSGMLSFLLEPGDFLGSSDGKKICLGWEDLLEKRMPTHCSIPTFRIPWAENPGRLQSIDSQRVRSSWAVGRWARAGVSQRLQMVCWWISPKTPGLMLYSEPILALPMAWDGGFASAGSTEENAWVQRLGGVSSRGSLEEGSHQRCSLLDT